MIAKLRGIIDSKGADWLIIDVNGVGYLVEASARTLSALPAPGEAAEVFTIMLVSETSMRLLGFATPKERDFYALLAAVQGVGPKVALALLSALSPSELATAIAMSDTAMLTRAQGVGPKLARRICSELKDRLPETLAVPAETAAAIAVTAPGGLEDEAATAEARDAISALVNLGYARAQAASAVAGAVREAGEGADAAKLIRLALKALASG